MNLKNFVEPLIEHFTIGLNEVVFKPTVNDGEEQRTEFYFDYKFEKQESENGIAPHVYYNQLDDHPFNEELKEEINLGIDGYLEIYVDNN